VRHRVFRAANRKDEIYDPSHDGQWHVDTTCANCYNIMSAWGNTQKAAEPQLDFRPELSGNWQAFFSRPPSRAHHRDALMRNANVLPDIGQIQNSVSHSWARLSLTILAVTHQPKASKPFDSRAALTKVSPTPSLCFGQYQNHRNNSNTCEKTN